MNVTIINDTNFSITSGSPPNEAYLVRYNRLCENGFHHPTTFLKMTSLSSFRSVYFVTEAIDKRLKSMEKGTYRSKDLLDTARKICG